MRISTCLALLVLLPTKIVGQEPDATKTYRLHNIPIVKGKIGRLDANGSLLLTELVNSRNGRDDHPNLTEGYYLGIGGFSRRGIAADSFVVRVHVEDILANRQAIARVAREAVPLFENAVRLTLIRPLGSTTADMKALPDGTPLVDATQLIPGMPLKQLEQLRETRRRLQQIGVAMLNFHDAYKCLPPAAIHGPDGKPWHSWRVLLLPFLDNKRLSERYRFDEPWNGPNNSKLLSEMPDVYRSPVRSDQAGRDTHFAAIVGKDTGLSAMTRFQGKFDLVTAIRGSHALRDFVDGTSNTVLVGMLPAETRIPWTKPDDVALGEQLPKLGQPNGFSADFAANRRKASLFLRADGSVGTICTDTDGETLRRLFVCNDGKVVREVPSLEPSPRFSRVPSIEVTRKNGRVTASFLWSRSTALGDGAGSSSDDAASSSDEAGDSSEGSSASPR